VVQLDGLLDILLVNQGALLEYLLAQPDMVALPENSLQLQLVGLLELLHNQLVQSVGQVLQDSLLQVNCVLQHYNYWPQQFIQGLLQDGFVVQQARWLYLLDNKGI
jgi:hypothetical protein